MDISVLFGATLTLSYDVSCYLCLWNVRIWSEGLALRQNSTTPCLVPQYTFHNMKCYRRFNLLARRVIACSCFRCHYRTTPDISQPQGATVAEVSTSILQYVSSKNVLLDSAHVILFSMCTFCAFIVQKNGNLQWTWISWKNVSQVRSTPV